jgi:type II restriction/modification system DNA methylase subunit YeeA
VLCRIDATFYAFKVSSGAEYLRATSVDEFAYDSDKKFFMARLLCCMPIY